MNTSLPESFDAPLRGKRAWVMGCLCLLAGAGVFALVAVHKLHPELHARAGNFRGKDPMPEWMALGAGAVFELAGVSILCSCLFKTGKPARQMQNLIGALILGFFAVIPFYALHAGAALIELPLIPQRWNQVFSQIAFGLLGIMFAVFTLALIVSTIRNWRS